MRLHNICLLVLSVGLALASPATAQTRTGVVLVHGKQGSQQNLQGLADALTAAGYAVDRPEMCWSGRRIYDLPYLDCLGDIDAAVERLRAAGASSIVIAGMSLGGNAALGYGARRDGLLGVIAMAPAPAMEFVSRRPDIGESVAKARQMIAQGLGDLRAVFKDINVGESFEVTTTANIYMTFLSPDSPGVMPDNASRQKAPLLIVSGQFDSTQRSVGYVFARAPSHPLNWHVTLHTNHRGTPAAARDTILAWLKALAFRGTRPAGSGFRRWIASPECYCWLFCSRSQAGVRRAPMPGSASYSCTASRARRTSTHRSPKLWLRSAIRLNGQKCAGRSGASTTSPICNACVRSVRLSNGCSSAARRRSSSPGIALAPTARSPTARGTGLLAWWRWRPDIGLRYSRSARLLRRPLIGPTGLSPLVKRTPECRFPILTAISPSA